MLAPSAMPSVWQVRRTRNSWELAAEPKPTQNGEYHTCLMTHQTRVRAVIQQTATLLNSNLDIHSGRCYNTHTSVSIYVLEV